jgi:transcriptional regulator with XRE-family HTH domain
MSIYFAQNLKHLRKRSSKTQEQLGQDVRLGRTTIANYEAGLSSPTDPEVLVRLSHLFDVSIDELLTRDLSRAFANTAVPFVQPPALADVFFPQVPAGPWPQGAAIPAAATEAQVPCIPKEAAGTYAASRSDKSWLDTLPLYTMPGLRAGTHRLFEVPDASMAPRFGTGDRLVCRRVTALEELLDGCPYILVTAAGYFLRRVSYRPHEGAALRLIADEPLAAAGAPHTVRREALLELWVVESVLSSDLAPPIGHVYARIADLEQQLRNLAPQANAPSSTL